MLPPAGLLPLIEAALQELPLIHRTPAALYQPMRYLVGLKAKRMRPLLVLLAYQAYGQEPQRCMPTAVAVELFHNFTLMHDDIMDNAPTRRGMPAVHVRWNSSTAILSGDALFAVAVRLAAQNFPAHAASLLDIFTQAALEVCEGQMEDMELASQPSAEVVDYLEMIRKKTAVLLGASLQLGAAAAGAPQQEQLLLQQFGNHIGIAFQLQDDLLDVYAEHGQFGKQPGGDIIENKKTYLWLRALQKASAAQQQELTSWYTNTNSNQHQEKVAAIRALYDDLQVAQDTRQLIQAYFEKAQQLLQPLKTRPGLAELELYLHQLLARDK